MIFFSNLAPGPARYRTVRYRGDLKFFDFFFLKKKKKKKNNTGEVRYSTVLRTSTVRKHSNKYYELLNFNIQQFKTNTPDKWSPLLLK